MRAYLYLLQISLHAEESTVGTILLATLALGAAGQLQAIHKTCGSIFVDKPSGGVTKTGLYH